MRLINLKRMVAGKHNYWSLALGIGLALLPIHNQWLTSHTSLPNGEALLFLPTIGYAVLFITLMMFTTIHWQRLLKSGLGDKKVWVPLLVISGAITISGFATTSPVAPLGAALLFGLLYLVARVLGKEIFYPLAVGAAIASLGVAAYQSIHSGTVTGGYVFEGNYDIVVGYVLLGSALFLHKYRPWLAGLALIAMLLTGSPEAIFSLAIVGIALLIRKDYTPKILAGAALLVLVLPAILYSTGLYGYVEDALYDRPAVANTGEPRQPFTYRLEQIGTAMTHIKPLGDGYSITEFREGIVHNTPLVIVQQLGWLGILAATAWLWVTIYCLRKTQWKYVWLLILSLSIFDHFIWTQLAPWWWAIAGASTMSLESDRILRKEVIIPEVYKPSPYVRDRMERIKRLMRMPMD